MAADSGTHEQSSTDAPPELTGSRVASIIQINVAFSVLTTIVIAVRVFSRVYINRSFGADDCEYKNGNWVSITNN